MSIDRQPAVAGSFYPANPAILCRQYETPRRLDRATTQAIEPLDPAALDHDAACGATPLAGLLVAARHDGMHVRTLDLRNSGDTAGPHDHVVGYGAYVVF
jgi:AmmeMemoRadiSam system protein B